MHINCVICSDLFTPSSDIYATPCGHIFHYTCLLQWLENSKTCPQCRTKVLPKSLIRLYMNIATSQGPDADITLLQHRLDSVVYTMNLKDQEIKRATSSNQEMGSQNKSLRKQIVELEVTEKRHQSIIAAQKNQIKFFKSQAQLCEQMRDEVTKLKTDMKHLEYVEVAINGSRQQVSEIIRNETSVESLGLLVATLKKSLIDADKMKKELQYELKKSRNEVSNYKRQMADMKSAYEDATKQVDSMKSNYDKEVAYLKDKFSQLQAKLKKRGVNESLNDSIRRITSESPVNFTRTPVLSGRTDDFIDLSEMPDTPPCAGSQFKSANKEPISIGDSPLIASSTGLFGIQRTKALASNTEKFSIFKGKESIRLKPYVTRGKAPDVMYNGLGGSSKEDIYPTAGTKRLKYSHTTSSKLKKLSAEAGKINRKPPVPQ